MYHPFPLSLAIVHSRAVIVQELQETLEQVCKPILQATRHWEDMLVFSESVSAAHPHPIIVILDAEDAHAEELVMRLQHDNAVVVLCARAEAARDDEDLLRLLERFGADIIFFPFDARAVQDMLERCRNYLTTKIFSRNLDDILSAKIHDDKNDHATRLALPTAQGNQIFSAESIVFLKAQRELTVCAVLDGETNKLKKINVFATLSDVVKKLPKRDFLRVHKSLVVNMRYAETFQHKGKDGILVMKQGEPLTVSRTYKKALVERIKGGQRGKVL